MEILIDNRGETPIYEQIVGQIREQILSGALEEHSLLPSIRSLAKDLRISFITTKRAYEELEKAGFLYAVPGKGCYVAPRNLELIREENLKKIEAHAAEIRSLGRLCGMTKAELLEIVDIILEDDL